mmetsp:Transcript_597/g.1947  ORF Transcript_597/g.1947 Transcript_597/m.1947 type:complete len:400 (+) Transcript_597:586-1785(+)
MPPREGLRLVGRGGHEVSGLAAVADDDILSAGRLGGRVSGRVVHEHGRVLRAVQRGAQELRHARVKLEKGVAVGAGGGDVLHCRDEATRVGDEERARLDLEVELAACARRKLFEGALDWLSDDGEVGRRLVRHAADLVPSAEVERGHGRDLLAEGEREAGDALPHRRVGAGADVRVHARGREVVLLDERLHVRKKLVPDAKRGGRAADVRLSGASRAEPGVEPHTELRRAVATPQPPVLCELAQRARVELDPEIEQLGQVGGRLLRGEGDAARRDARRDGAPHLVPGGGVHVQAEPVKGLQHGGVWARLHGEADRQAVCTREGQRRLRLRLERRLRVDVRRSAVAVLHLARGRLREEAQPLVGALGSHHGALRGARRDGARRRHRAATECQARDSENGG